ncbi:energy-coupling factor transporter transmembrane protein EcfT [Aliiroseovarius sp. S1123]|uniref:energy-coupling factor transporter transmembrane component T family protein n=1 Tax=unclassified Aliiroseovarius TaxID=2623558 RepID=UPI001FF4771A|nr:energy-coupling factor transporter transmembrane protein EcfT [Aliiroseovarius sp. S1123]MCK0171542.1 energy-coupling factor transporter transmembrane protein EcfT [Aliiroseovarius sp. S1123]
MISLTSPIETRAHGWPAGLKLAGLCVVTIVLFQMQSLWFHLAAFATTLALYALPGQSFLHAGLRALKVLWPFVLLVGIYHIIIRSPVDGMVIILRMLTAVGLANLVTMTTRLSDMISVVRWLATPLRALGLRTEYLETAIALVIRFTPVLLAKGTHLTEAWRARSARRPGWRIILPFTVLALDDADHIADALRARGGFDAMKE